MPPDDNKSRDDPALKSIEGKLAEIANWIGHNRRPDDPELARRWDQPIYSQLSDLRDSNTVLRNLLQTLLDLLQRLLRRAEQNAEISAENQRRLGELGHKIETSSAQLKEAADRVARDKPLLMRDLFWLPTEPVEIGLILYTSGEALIYLMESEALIRSVMFKSLGGISESPEFWGTICGLLALVSTVFFLCRVGALRRSTACMNFIYFFVTGAVPIFLAGPIMGWVPHLLAALGAMWVALRGPSNAIIWKQQP